MLVALHMERCDLRNVALVAHVDHGKTTVVEQMLRHAASQADEPISSDAVLPVADALTFPVVRMVYANTVINLIDTPSQIDFGGESERALQLADGVLVLVDATEPPLPHTRFALRWSIGLGHPLVIMVNKIDRPDASPERVVESVRTLLRELEASPQQVASPIVYASARAGLSGPTPDLSGSSFRFLFDTLLSHVPAPASESGSMRFWVHRRFYDENYGPLAIGRVHGRAIEASDEVVVHSLLGPRSATASPMLTFDGREYQRNDCAIPGDVIAVAGLGNVNEGDAVTMQEACCPSPAIRAAEPTLELTIGVNRSPLAGKSRASNFLTGRQIEERLVLATQQSSGIRFEKTSCKDTFRVFVRGELLLATLADSMRREGYEVEMSRPEVATKQVDQQKCEPVELVLIDVPEGDIETITQRMHARGGRLVRMSDPGFGRAHFEFRVRSRALLGCRRELRRATRGMALMTTLFAGWAPWQGPRAPRPTGAIVADRDGRATPYALYHLQPRGLLFQAPGALVFEGMIVGEHNRGQDIFVNVTKERKVAAIPFHGREQRVFLAPASVLTIGAALSWMNADELVEVTPESVRIRKAQ